MAGKKVETTVGIREWVDAGPVALDRLINGLERRRAAGQCIVTTNGCFDLLHPGHIRFLQAARALGDVLVVGLNSDVSVRRLKGAGRPLISEGDRAAQLLALRAVDHVVIFDDALPNDLLTAVRPHIHCKAGDYRADSLPEAKIVRQHGGQIQILPLLGGFSTSLLVERAQMAARESDSNKDHDPHVDWRAQAIDQLMADANLLRQTAYAVSDQIAQLADRIAAALRFGGRVLLHSCDADAAHARYAAATCRESLGCEWADQIVTWQIGSEQDATQCLEQTRRSADVLIELAVTDHAPIWPDACATAQARALDVVEIRGLWPSSLPEPAALTLIVPDNRPSAVCKAQLAVLHVASSLAKQALAEGAAP